MEEYKLETAQDLIKKSCRSFMQTIVAADLELNNVFLANMEGLTKTEEQKCKVFLHNSSESCREMVKAAISFLQCYNDDEVTTDREEETQNEVIHTVNEIKIERDPGDIKEEQPFTGAAFATESQLEPEYNDNNISDKFEFKSTASDGDLVDSNTVDEPKHSIETATASIKIRDSPPRKQKLEAKNHRKPRKNKSDDVDDDYIPESVQAPKQRKKSARSGVVRKLWPCEECIDVSFKSRKLLRTHQEEVHGISPTVRKPISKKPTQKQSDGEHEATEAQIKYECEVCVETFRVYLDYFRHRKFQHPDHFYQHGGLEEEAANTKMVKPLDLRNIRVERGVVVDITTQPENAVRSQVLEPPPKSSVPTDDCEQGDGTAKAKVGNKDKPSVCDICGKRYKSRISLKKHIQTHTRPYQCKTCGNRYATATSLTYHERIHTGETPHKCDQCDMSFHTSTLLHSHMLTVHCTVKPYQCEQCPASFRHKNTLAVHMVRKHSSVRPYTCGICDKKFVVKQDYNRHMAQHSGIRDYKCDQCDSSFCTQKGLQEHRRACRSEKNFVCHVCAKAFSRHSNLKSHMKMHSDEKNFACDICGKRFARAYDLKLHVRRHTGEKPYKCDVCGRGFLCPDYVSKHKKNKHR